MVPARQRRSISSNPVTLAWPERYILALLLMRERGSNSFLVEP